MRITLFLTLVGILQVFAVDSFSQMKTISLKMEQARIVEVLNAIENQSQFRFIYSPNTFDVNDKVTVTVNNQQIDNVLKELFTGKKVTYQVFEKQIVLSSTDAMQSQKDRKVNGKVTDSAGEPLPGVAVVVKGTTQGTVTSFDGSYELTVPAGNDILLFSFVGMASQEVSVGNKSEVNVIMKESAIGLEEVVAIGYGTTTKRKMVSSISSIGTDEIADAPYTSVINGLAGRTPGLFVRESGGEYGSTPTISIRGGGEPAYVIDGILASKSEFSMIPAHDIETISFLKDASAAAVYGFNSANGVVLISTKKGNKEKISLSYSGIYAMQRPTLLPDYLSPYEIALMKNQAAFNDGLPAVVSDEMLNTLKNNLDPIRYPNLNPFDEAVKKGAMQKEHNISLNGTIENTSIFMSLNYYGQDGIYKTSSRGLNRYSFRSNISHNFKTIGLTVDGNVNYQRSLKVSPATSSWEIWSHVRNWGSGAPLYNPDGNYYGLQNPLAEADDRGGYNHQEVNRLNGKLSFVWEIPHVKGLTLKAIGNYRLDHGFNKFWSANQRNSAPIYTWDNQVSDMGKPSLSESTGRTYRYDLEGHVNYQRTFAQKHTVELTGVYSQSEAVYDGFSAYRKDFVSPAVDQLFAGSAEGKDNSGNASESGRIGYIGRVKYDYDAKYILEGNFRYDGYDGFPTDQKYKLFPSMSFGWNIDREAFIKPLMEKIQMNSFKIRASWGELGKLGENDDEIAALRFSHLSVYNLVNNVYYMGDTWRTGFQEGPLTPSAGTTSWYEVNSKNLGFDFGFWNSKLSGSFDWFYYRTTGFLGSPAASYTTPLGKPLPKINTDSAHRRGGVELNANYKTRIDEVIINVGGNISYYDQLWEKKYDEDTTSLKNPYSRQTQQKDYYTRGYINQGYYQDLNQVLNSPRRLGSTETMPGDLVYQDFNGDGRLDGDDQIRIGKSDFPHIVYGFYLNAEYKGFTLDALFQGTSNRQVYLGGMWRNEINHKLYQIQTDSWTPENRNALFPRTSSFNNVNGSNNNVTSDFWLVDAWYLRMKSLSLSYNLKSSLLRNLNEISQCSILLSATNLFTISPVTKYYMDPETSSSDNYGYPVAKTYSIGLRVTF